MQANSDLSKQWDAAAEAGDIEGMLDTYTEDAILMMPDVPALRGKEAIRSAFEDFFEQVSLESESLVEEVRLAGDWAYVRGTFTSIETPTGGGEPSQIDGHWIDIRERQADGSWRVSANMWNRDAPLPSAE